MPSSFPPPLAFVLGADLGARLPWLNNFRDFRPFSRLADSSSIPEHAAGVAGSRPYFPKGGSRKGCCAIRVPFDGRDCFHRGDCVGKSNSGTRKRLSAEIPRVLQTTTHHHWRQAPLACLPVELRPGPAKQMH